MNLISKRRAMVLFTRMILLVAFLYIDKPAAVAQPVDPIEQRIKAQVASAQWNLTGGSTMEDQRQAENEAAGKSMGELTSEAFSSFNAVIGIGQLLERVGVSSDHHFKLSESWQPLTYDIPGEYHNEFLSIGSLGEGYLLKQQIKDHLKSQALLEAANYRGQVSILIARLFDLPSLLLVLVLYGLWSSYQAKHKKTSIDKV